MTYPPGRHQYEEAEGPGWTGVGIERDRLQEHWERLVAEAVDVREASRRGIGDRE